MHPDLTTPIPAQPPQWPAVMGHATTKHSCYLYLPCHIPPLSCNSLCTHKLTHPPFYLKILSHNLPHPCSDKSPDFRDNVVEPFCCPPTYFPNNPSVPPPSYFSSYKHLDQLFHLQFNVLKFFMSMVISLATLFIG